MTQKKATPTEPAPTAIVPDEDWTVAQVASHMELSYQTARNQMLQGLFGVSKYDAAKRKLTVSMLAVQRAKSRAKTRTKTKKKSAPRKHRTLARKGPAKAAKRRNPS